MRYCFEAAAEHGGGGVREEVQHENFHALIQEPGTIHWRIPSSAG